LIPRESVEKLDETFGYAYMSSPSNGLSKDFIGFEDGNANPKTDEQRVFNFEFLFSFKENELSFRSTQH